MAKGKKRLTIRNLVPGEKYAVQVRAVDNDGASTWSQKFHFVAADDSMGGTRTPKAPVLSTFAVDESGQYVGVWTTVTENTDDSFTVISRYETELDWNGYKVFVSQTIKEGATQTRSFSYATLSSLFGGQVPPTLTLRVRAVNSAGTISPWSNPITASLPIPDPPRNVVAEGVMDGINIRWDAPLNTDHLTGYRVYLGTTENFVPSPTNLVYQGAAQSFAYTTMSYDVLHYFKVVSYSAAGMESTAVQVSAKPNSPFGPDNVPPLTPTLDNPVMDRTVLSDPKANLTWTINEAHADNEDLAGFVVRWRLSTETDWRTAYFDKASRTGTIGLPQPFANYQFQISAYDFLANYSAYSATKTLTGAVAAPAQVTGVSSIARFDGLKITWTESTSDSVKYGGKYHVQVKESNSFPNDTPDYVTGNTYIDVSGLPALSTAYVRVRAEDAAGQVGPWSTVHTKTLPPFPTPEKSDGVAPTAAPTGVSAMGGLNYINVSWTPISNNDPVTYEVFMGTTAGFTEAPSNRVGTSGGSSFVVSSDASGAALAKDTTYYFKVRAVDYDGNGPVSSAANATLSRVLHPDLGIDLPGDNLYVNSSFELESAITPGLAAYWSPYYNPVTPGVTVVPTRVSGRTGGFAQRLTWNGASASNKGITSSGSPVTAGNTEYVFSFYARASAGTGFTVAFNNQPVANSIVWLSNPTPSATEWKRYAVRFVTTATPEPNNVYAAIVGNNTAAGWVEFDDMQIEAGGTASAYKSGTVSFAKISSGRMSTSELIVERTGIIRSDNWNTTNKTGWSLSSAGLILYSGTVRANTLEAGSSFVNDLNVASTLTVGSSGVIKSSNYNTTNGTGFQISTAGIDIRQGFVAAGALGAGTITSPDIKVGANGKITIDSTGTIQSNNYSATTGWKIGSDGIEMNDSYSKISVAALKSGTLETTTLTIGSGGTIRSSTWAGGTGARWILSETGFTLYNGAIIGTSVATDQLVSISVDPITNMNTFSINVAGYAEFSGAKIYGNTSVGTGTSNVIQSGNYVPNTVGWRIDGSGLAEFSNITSRYTKPASGGDPAITMATKIYTGPNPFEGGQSWNVIEMQAGNSAWSPALIWTKYSGGADPSGSLDITSPRLGVRNPARISLISTEGTNLTSIQMNAQSIYQMADKYIYGREGANDVRFQLAYSNAGTARRFSFQGPMLDGTPGKRINLSLGEAGLNRISSLDENGNNQRLDVTAHAVFFETSGANGNLGIYGQTGSGNRVMLGTTSGGIAGNGIVFGGEGDNWRIRFTNNSGTAPVEIVASNVALSSDMTQKRNIKPVTERMSKKIQALTAYDYNRLSPDSTKKKERVSKEKSRGLMAQEVKEVMPEVVTGVEGSDEGLAIDIYGLLTNAIVALGEHEQEIEELKAEIENLKGNKK